MNTAPKKIHCNASNKLGNYILAHSKPLTKGQKWLIEETKHEKHSNMLSSTDEMILLSNIAYGIQAKKTLDIGVYTGYSALSIAHILPPDGKVYALDVSYEYYDKYCLPAWKIDKVEDKIEFICAPALETLHKLLEKPENKATFDFAFLDADKTSYSDYYKCVLELLRPGGILAVDNTLWSNKVLEDVDAKEDPDTAAIQRLNELIAEDFSVYASMIPMADGVTIVTKKF